MYLGSCGPLISFLLFFWTPPTPPRPFSTMFEKKQIVLPDGFPYANLKPLSVFQPIFLSFKLQNNQNNHRHVLNEVYSLLCKIMKMTDRPINIVGFNVSHPYCDMFLKSPWPDQTRLDGWGSRPFSTMFEKKQIVLPDGFPYANLKPLSVFQPIFLSFKLQNSQNNHRHVLNEV